MCAGLTVTASSVTDELASWASSRVAARETLDPDLFSAAAAADLTSLLTAAARNVSRDVAGQTEPGKLDSFPVLATYLDILATQWRAMSQELDSRLGSDLPDLARCFNGGQPVGRVMRIRGDTGDRHRQGRQVITLEFESGCSIVYKPRDVGPDRAFGELLNWLSESASLPVYRCPTTIRCAGYGWAEFIEARPATATADQQTLWRRIGGLLAVLDTLNARDCHWQNVVVAADQPVLIDAEGLFHRALLGERASRPGSTSALSVLATGWTPYWKRDGDLLRESSGAGSPPPQQIKQVLDGFADAYRSLLARRSELLDPAGPLSRFESVSVRTIFRDTAYYQERMRAACTKDCLESPARHEAALEELSREDDDPRLAQVEKAELAALRRLDVPRFTAQVGGKAVDLDGRIIPDWFEATGLEVVRDRIQLLSEPELARKLDHLRAIYALAALEASF